MSIYRIGTNTTNENSMYHLTTREYMMDKVNNQISTGKKHRLPSESPVDVTQAMTFHSKMFKIEQLERNINDLTGERMLAESKMSSTIDMLQRARELAVQGSNGIYNEENRLAMSQEVDQLLRNLILEANSKYKGNYLFSGHQKYTKPFEVIEGAVKGADSAMITEVHYLGDSGKHLREIDFNEYASAVPAGSELFWAEQFEVRSKVNTADFRLEEDAAILIDGVRIDFQSGDNIYAVMDKINKSDAAVNASVDITDGGLIIKSAHPHRIEMADIEGGKVLQNLGVIEEGFPFGPNNYSKDADVFGGSIFDVLIGLRDAMIQNNSEDIGGRYLGALDEAVNNITFHQAKTGALQNRLDYLSERLGDDKAVYTETMSKLEDVDMAKALTDLSALDFAHKAALSSLAKITKTSLMDFLR